MIREIRHKISICVWKNWNLSEKIRKYYGKTLVTGGIQRIHIYLLLCFGCLNSFMECERRDPLQSYHLCLKKLENIFEKIVKYYCKTAVIGGIYGYIYIYCYVFDV